MKAILYKSYGGADVLELGTAPRPELGETEVLVRVEATSVTTADWRLRSASFPGIMQVPGRLMFGLLRPRNPVLGTDFSGTIEAVGAKVTRFRKSDAVFGFSGAGAYGEYLKMPEDGAITAKPATMSHGEAAALPFGGLAALVFLRDFAKLARGEKVLVVGASGGVGAYAVQIAKALGAEVTGVASGPHLDLVRALGADQVIDYRAEDFTKGPKRYDIVLDTVGTSRYAAVRPVLNDGGRFVPLNFGLSEIWQALTASLRGSKRVVIGVNGDSRTNLETLLGMVGEGALRPVIDRVYPLEAMREAHAHVESRHRKGAVIVQTGSAWETTTELQPELGGDTQQAASGGLRHA